VRIGLGLRKLTLTKSSTNRLNIIFVTEKGIRE